MGMTVAENEATPDAAAAPHAGPETATSSTQSQAPSMTSGEPANEPVRADTAPRPEAAATPGITPAAPTAAAVTARPGANRPPSRFLADLVRAMQSTAEENRETLVGSLRAEGKTAVEQIHARSAEEVDGLRRVADDDVAGIKDWSKTEIARIRTETEERIAERKQELELSLEGHAALVEREIEHVQARIADYEAEMDAFFVRLGEIDDPSEFAATAAEMPEPPSLEEASAAARAAALDELIRETAAARTPEPQRVEAVAEPVPAMASVETVKAVAEPVPAVESVETIEGVAEPVPAVESVETVEAVAEPVPAVASVENFEAVAEPVERVEAVAEPVHQAAASTVTVEDRTVEDPWRLNDHHSAEAQAVAEAVAESSQEPDGGTDGPAGDPRLAALGLSADAPDAESTVDETEIDALSEATIAARLGDASKNGSSAPESTTSVVVIGLVSVASVASFKRTLAKTAGVRSVGVSSGPEGEFVFRTTHDADLVLKDIIPTLPGFGARVVAAGDGVVNVSARDPESEA